MQPYSGYEILLVSNNLQLLDYGIDIGIVCVRT